MTEGKMILGVFLIVAGIALMFIPVFGWIYGPIVLGVGIALIVLRNSDNEIESRKDLSPKNNKQLKTKKY